MAFNPYSQRSEILNEHDQMLQDLSLVLATPNGKSFIKYLMKHFAVGELPEIGLPDDIKAEYIGFLRAGQSLFEIVSQADSMTAGLILAQIQKEKFNVLKDS